jgi:hypothetical protein
MKNRLDNRLYYFTVEDESLLAETFPRLGDETYAIAYKVVGTDDVFVTTAETKDAMERHDLPYNCLAEEDGIRVAIFHNELSREELGDYEEALKALALANRSIALFCVGVNHYSYFSAPAGHTFLWRLFTSRAEAIEYVEARHADLPHAVEWAHSMALTSSDELATYH